MSRWSAWHLHYHSQRERAVVGWVRPLVSSLLREGLIDRFFFIRYSLGGPHVRLRLRAAEDSHPEGADQLAAGVTKAAEDFLSSHPSTEPMPEEKVAALTEALRQDDPTGDPTVHPDNVLVPQAFHPESGRYGGEGVLDHSLDFFMLSSLGALDWLVANPSATPGRRLNVGFRLLARQGLGFGGSIEELETLVEEVSGMWGEKTADSLRKRSDQTFERQGEIFVNLLRAEISAVLEESEPVESGIPFLRGARRLAWVASDLSESARRRLFASQIHMTANRLGLVNAEEVYLGNLMKRALGHAREQLPELIAELDGRLAECREKGCREVDLAAAAEEMLGPFEAV